MNKIKLLTIAVVALLLLNVGMMTKLLFFYKDKDHGPPRHGGPKMIIIKKLGFDEVQQVEYESLIHDHRRQIDALQAETMRLKDELYSLLIAPEPDMAAADSITLEIAEKQKMAEKVNFSHFADIKALCKPEQLPAFHALVTELTQLFDHKRPPHR